MSIPSEVNSNKERNRAPWCDKERVYPFPLHSPPPARERLVLAKSKEEGLGSFSPAFFDEQF